LNKKKANCSMTEILSTVSPWVFSWSTLGRGSSEEFLSPRPEMGCNQWLTLFSNGLKIFPPQPRCQDLNSELKYVKRTLMLNCYPKWMINNITDFLSLYLKLFYRAQLIWESL